MIKDSKVISVLGVTIKSVLNDPSKTDAMCKALRDAARPEACSMIVDEIETLLTSKK